jgi:hypothetical protein
LCATPALRNLTVSNCFPASIDEAASRKVPAAVVSSKLTEAPRFVTAAGLAI